jgi:hypothetical protein
LRFLGSFGGVIPGSEDEDAVKIYPAKFHPLGCQEKKEAPRVTKKRNIWLG